MRIVSWFSCGAATRLTDEPDGVMERIEAERAPPPDVVLAIRAVRHVSQRVDELLAEDCRVRHHTVSLRSRCPLVANVADV